MFEDIVSFQREIYLALATQIKAFANGGGWGALLGFLPMGVLFGAAHALTPGHSKTVLAAYLAGSPLGLARGLGVSLALSFTHVAMSVLIALLSLPLVSVVLGSVGRAPLLEDMSRGLLGVIGVWMLYRALRRRAHTHSHGEGIAFGVMAGLVPCPLTLFAMTFAISRGVPQAGMAFAATMMAGVALTLCAVALASVFFRQKLTRLIETRPVLLDRATRTLEAAAAVTLIAIAARELLYR
jgi:nickel/cobalt transporter (NicO) family protein